MKENGRLNTASSGLMLINGDGGWKGAIAFTIVWNLLAWPFAFVFLNNANSKWFDYLFVLIFPLVGLAFIFFTLKTFLLNRRLGKPLLILQHAGLPGKEPFQAKIQFNPPLGTRLDSAEMIYPVKVSLVCMREDRRSDDAKLTTLWEGVAVRSDFPRGTNEFNLRMELPETLPEETAPGSKLVREYWQVVLEALGATIKYEVPVATENMARADVTLVNQPGRLTVADTGNVKSRQRAPRFVQWIVLLIVIFMVWDFAGDLISPFVHSLVLDITGQKPEKILAQADRVHKPGKLVTLELDSLAGNGFGVVAKVTGEIEIGKDEVAVFPHTIELRSIYNCDQDCPFIRSVHFSLTRDEGSYFSSSSSSAEIPVNEKLPDSGSLFVNISEAQKKIYLKVSDRFDLSETRLTLDIAGDVMSNGKIGQASWYTHTKPFSSALGETPKPIEIAVGYEDRLVQARQVVMEDRIEDLQLLLNTGLDVNARDAQGETMLMYAASRGNLQIVKLLIAKQADVNLATPLGKDGSGGNTALHDAVRQDAVEVVDVLMGAGARVDAVANQVWTPIHYAAYRGAVKTMKYFHAKNINIDEPFKGARGSTPLMLAAQYDRVEMMETLLKLGADPLRKDVYGENACGYAKFFKKAAAISALKCN